MRKFHRFITGVPGRPVVAFVVHIAVWQVGYSLGLVQAQDWLGSLFVGMIASGVGITVSMGIGFLLLYLYSRLLEIDPVLRLYLVLLVVCLQFMGNSVAAFFQPENVDWRAWLMMTLMMGIINAVLVVSVNVSKPTS